MCVRAKFHDDDVFTVGVIAIISPSLILCIDVSDIGLRRSAMPIVPIRVAGVVCCDGMINDCTWVVSAKGVSEWCR